MTVDEGQKVIEQFEAEGKTKEEIAGAFYLLFRDGKIDINGLEGLVNLLGFELDDEFKAMSPEDQKNYGYELADEQPQEEEEGQGEEEAPTPAPQKEEEESEEPAQNDEKDDEKEEAEGLGYFEGRAPKKEDEDDEEEKEARKLLKY